MNSTAAEQQTHPCLSAAPYLEDSPTKRMFCSCFNLNNSYSRWILEAELFSIYSLELERIFAKKNEIAFLRARVKIRRQPPPFNNKIKWNGRDWFNVAAVSSVRNFRHSIKNRSFMRGGYNMNDKTTQRRPPDEKFETRKNMFFFCKWNERRKMGREGNSFKSEAEKACVSV
jgi:hypothetical protein